MKEFEINNQYLSPLGQSVQTAYNKLIQTVSQVPAHLYNKKEINGTGGKVSISDIIAYQIGWGNLLISWYEAGIQGKQPTMPGEGFTTWDYVGLANHFYTKYHFDVADKQLKTFHDIVAKILDIVENEYATGNLDKQEVWQWCTLKSGNHWPLSKWVTVNTVSPYKKATTLIRGLVKQL